MPHDKKERQLNVVLVEDDEEYIKTFRGILEHKGITVAIILKSVEEVEKALNEAMLASIHAVFVDGNLSPDSSGGSDGVFVAHKIKEKHPNIVIIGNSSNSFSDPTAIDYDFSKRIRLSYEESEVFLREGIYNLVEEKAETMS